MVWKRRRDSGTVHAKAEKAAEANTMSTKTTLWFWLALFMYEAKERKGGGYHNVRKPASVALSKTGGSGLMHSLAICSDNWAMKTTYRTVGKAVADVSGLCFSVDVAFIRASTGSIMLAVCCFLSFRGSLVAVQYV